MDYQNIAINRGNSVSEFYIAFSQAGLYNQSRILGEGGKGIAMYTFENRVKNTKLTKIEQRVAEFILSNFEYIAFMKSADIAEKLHISSSSVVRVSRTLGYTGFNEMMACIRDEIIEQINDSNANNISPASKLTASWNTLDSDDPISRYLEKVQTVTKSVFEKNNAEKFRQAKEFILNANTRYIAGFYGCRPLADLFTIHLARVLPQTFSILHADSDAYVRLINITNLDCLILFSYERYADIAIRASQIAHDAGAKVVAITDKITAPVAQGADVILLSDHDSGSFFNSSAALVMILEVLTLNIAGECSGTTQVNLRQIDKYLMESSLF